MGSSSERSTSVFVFRCPSIGGPIQARSHSLQSDTFETISCIACGELHVVSRMTGEVVGGHQPQRNYAACFEC